MNYSGVGSNYLTILSDVFSGCNPDKEKQWPGEKYMDHIKYKY